MLYYINIIIYKSFLGLVTDQYSTEMGLIVEHAIEVANAEIKIPLEVIKEEVNYGDSFQAYGILCKLLQVNLKLWIILIIHVYHSFILFQNGVGGIFGPSSKHTARHLTTICDAKDVPYFFSELNENPEAFNLYPHSTDFSKALYFLLIAYKWSRFIFLYESGKWYCATKLFWLKYKSKPPIRVSITIQNRFSRKCQKFIHALRRNRKLHTERHNAN